MDPQRHRESHGYIELPSKSGHPIWFQLIKSSSSVNGGWLVVLINGLRLPSESWKESITRFDTINDAVAVHLLSYDRFGQGKTIARDPLDADPSKEIGYGHDLKDCAEDLHELVQRIVEDELDSQPIRVVLVAASIGAHIARLYAHAHPEMVEGLLILDSNIGHIEYSDLWPDPKCPAFDPQDVIEDDCTLEQYLKATRLLASMFNTNVKNAEGLDRRNTKELLPSAAEPGLVTKEYAPWISILCHDPQTFADQSYAQLDVPRSISMKYINPTWVAYNQQLLRLTSEARQLGFSIAHDSGHFIQVDRPDLVASSLLNLLRHCVMDAKTSALKPAN